MKNGPQQVRAQQARANSQLAAVKQAQARVDQARLNLGYCHITAPIAGIINKKNVDVGVNLSIGQDVLTVIPLTNLWVTANFKETQLDRMRPGQSVKISVDALGGRKFNGKVTQIGGATGSRLSLFPPENATGNYVKVVQRIPVRIDFTDLKDDDCRLRPASRLLGNPHGAGKVASSAQQNSSQCTTGKRDGQRETALVPFRISRLYVRV